MTQTPDLTITRKSSDRRVTAKDNRKFLEAVLWIAIERVYPEKQEEGERTMAIDV